MGPDGGGGGYVLALCCLTQYRSVTVVVGEEIHHAGMNQSCESHVILSTSSRGSSRRIRKS